MLTFSLFFQALPSSWQDKQHAYPVKQECSSSSNWRKKALLCWLPAEEKIHVRTKPLRDFPDHGGLLEIQRIEQDFRSISRIVIIFDLPQQYFAEPDS